MNPSSHCSGCSPTGRRACSTGSHVPSRAVSRPETRAVSPALLDSCPPRRTAAFPAGITSLGGGPGAGRSVLPLPAGHRLCRVCGTWERVGKLVRVYGTWERVGKLVRVYGTWERVGKLVRIVTCLPCLRTVIGSDGVIISAEVWCVLLELRSD